MTTVLAAEGGYQEFTLGSAEWTWLIISGICALIALAVGFILARGVIAADQGTPKMREIAAAIQEGAMAYLRRQFRTILVILSRSRWSFSSLPPRCCGPMDPRR